MEPYYEREGITLYHADCREVMASLENGSVDAVITDPPYGVDFAEWDGEIPDWLDAARRLSSVVIFTTAPETQWDYPRPTWVCNWYRPASSSRSLMGGGFNHWSPILVYGHRKFPVDTINLHAISNAYPPGFWHPSPKPESLMEWLVQHGSDDGSTVFDPFGGSMTTGVAAWNLGRRCILCEISEEYCELGAKRLDRLISQGRLFRPEPVKETQRSMFGDDSP